MNESNPVALFISEKVVLTENYSDTVELADAYAYFTEWAASYNFKRMGTKQQFRSAMEDMDIVYTTARANRKVFRYIKIEHNNFDDFDDL